MMVSSNCLSSFAVAPAFNQSRRMSIASTLSDHALKNWFPALSRIFDIISTRVGGSTSAMPRSSIARTMARTVDAFPRDVGEISVFNLSCRIFLDSSGEGPDESEINVEVEEAEVDELAVRFV